MLSTSNDQILNEIGELFGRFRNENGHLEFFQSKMLKSNGSAVSSSKDYDDWLKDYTNDPNNQQKQANAKDPFINGILNSSFYEKRFYEWQKRVLDRLQNRKNDIYVVAPPGGGKTTPLMAHYMVDIFMGGQNGSMPSIDPEGIFKTPDQKVVDRWSNIFHGLLSGKYLNGDFVPKCLFVTPIRVLSFEQAEGFQEYFIDLMLFLKSLMLKCTKRNQNESFSAYTTRLKLANSSNVDKIIGTVFGSLGEERFNRLDLPDDSNGTRFNGYVKQFTEKMICVKTGGGNGQFNDNPDNAVVSIATYGSAKQFINKIAKTVKFIVFDEAHLYMPSEYGPASDRSQQNEVIAAADAYKIIDGMAKQKEAQIAFLSGTIHPDSAENFCRYLNRYYGRNLAVVTTEKGDTQSGNKTELHVIADDAIREDKEQVNRIIKWVQSNEKGKAIILFSKKKINNLVDEALKRLSQKDIRSGEFNINQSDRYRREKIDRYRRALAYSNKDATAEDIQKAVKAYIEKEFPTTQEENVKKIKSKPGAMMITNKKLRTAVSYGIGYIYTQDDVELNDPKAIVGEVIEPVKEQDKLIVADLFSQGKINVLLATPAIGVGVNVNIKDMYLPSCMRFERNKNNEGKIDLNNKREMSQLVNRTGRGKTPISGIYTPREFVPFMREVVMMGNEDFNKVPAISVNSSDNLKDILINLSTAASRVKNAGNYTQSVPGRITKKLQQFTNMAKAAYQERLDIRNQNRARIQQGDPKELEKQRKEVKLQREAADRLMQYNSSQIKIDDLDFKIRSMEVKIQNKENKITEWEKELAGLGPNGIPNAAREAQLRGYLILWKNNLKQDFVDLKILVVDEYNKILKELDEINKSAENSDKNRMSESQKHHDILTDRLNRLRNRYNFTFLDERNKTIRDLNKEMEEINRDLQTMITKHNQAMNNQNVPQSIRDALKDSIDNTRKYMQRTIDKTRRIQYYTNP